MNFRSVRNLLFALVLLGMSAAAFAQVGVSITIAPPALPVYEQPICPGDGYLWTPGYWGWGDDFNDYYWVPGTWVTAPEVGFLWTPPYWGWGGGGFLFHEGFWGPTIGFYGGINYGFGYFGVGFAGGRWDNGQFFYNRSVTNINVTNVHNVYNTTVENTTVNRVSYNGGNGGVDARPTPQEEAAANERHIAPVAAQTQHVQEARSNPQQRASTNQGKPAVAATAKPGDFKDGAVQAREAGAPYTAPANRAGNQTGENGSAPRADDNAARSNPAVHVRDLPPSEKLQAPNTGDAKLDKKYQLQQEKQYAQQEQERQKIAQKQQAEDDKLTKQNANDTKKQQVEQQHQQQTQQFQQRQSQQRQQLQQSQQPAAPRAAPRPR